MTQENLIIPGASVPLSAPESGRAKPILFSGPMVRALLDGRKTQTRRALSRAWPVLGSRWGTNAPWAGLRFDEAIVRKKSMISGEPDACLAVPFWHPSDGPMPSSECGIYAVRPPIETGDRLWVRESMKPKSTDPELLAYAADDMLLSEWDPECERDWPTSLEKRPYVPSIFLPRWASRLTLTVTDVRVERLQDISEEDAEAEGCTSHDDPFWRPSYSDPDSGGKPSCRNTFEWLWDQINGNTPGAWDANPWVAAYTFTVERRNIDAPRPPA